jgi:uncharacterized membrane protein YjdF
MKKNSLLLHIGIISFFFALAHIIALKLSIYWTTDGFDSVMHTVGGIIGAWLVVYVLQKIGITGKTIPRKILLFMFVVISVLAVGAIWELWEIFTGMTNPFTDMIDTISDLCMDVLGSCIGFIYYEKRIKPKTE